VNSKVVISGSQISVGGNVNGRAAACPEQQVHAPVTGKGPSPPRCEGWNLVARRGIERVPDVVGGVPPWITGVDDVQVRGIADARIRGALVNRMAPGVTGDRLEPVTPSFAVLQLHRAVARFGDVAHHVEGEEVRIRVPERILERLPPSIRG